MAPLSSSLFRARATLTSLAASSAVTVSYTHLPQQRGVGLLFQNYALFPNMTVEQNVLCGLKAEKDKAARKMCIRDRPRRATCWAWPALQASWRPSAPAS